MKYPSRNKIVEHDYCYCPYCHEKITKEQLDDETNYYKFLDEKIVYCIACGEEFIPNKTKNIVYRYSGRCKKHESGECFK